MIISRLCLAALMATASASPALAAGDAVSESLKDQAVVMCAYRDTTKEVTMDVEGLKFFLGASGEAQGRGRSQKDAIADLRRQGFGTPEKPCTAIRMVGEGITGWTMAAPQNDPDVGHGGPAQ